MKKQVRMIGMQTAGRGSHILSRTKDRGISSPNAMKKLRILAARMSHPPIIRAPPNAMEPRYPVCAYQYRVQLYVKMAFDRLKVEGEGGRRWMW